MGADFVFAPIFFVNSLKVLEKNVSCGKIKSQRNAVCFAVVHPKNARVLFYALFVLILQRAGNSGPGGKNTVARGKKSMPPDKALFGGLAKNTSV